MNRLALFGGRKTIEKPLPQYRSLSEKEMNAVVDVMNSGQLSGFYGSARPEFYGGPVVQRLESSWKKRFSVQHAVTVNSATSGLYMAMAAIGISPGDEVIVPPYTMSATAMAPLVYGGIPVFADIEDETFGLAPESVEQNITPATKAIIAVNLFGHPARLSELKQIAKKHNLWLVEDNAQSPLAEDNGVLTGTIGDIGVFSLNYHKHIHAGEGGVCVTDNDVLAERMMLVRNHGENVVDEFNVDNLVNMVGFNYRMTELTAAIAFQQLDDIDEHVGKREDYAKELSEGIAALEGITAPVVRAGCRHVYYLWSLRFDENILGISRKRFCDALAAEGVPLMEGYVLPIYRLPLFQKRIAFGDDGYPFNLSNRTYDGSICPIAETMYDSQWAGFGICNYDLDNGMTEKIVGAFHKVYGNRDNLQD